MAQKNFYKPRNTLAYITKSKVWPAKNAYLRRFYAIRGRRLRREQGLFRRCVLVATTRKWTAARRFMRPLRQSVRSRTTSSTNKKAFGRPFKRRYRNRFYAKQQLRLFHGEVKESVFRIFFQNHLSAITSRSKSFFSALESRLDMVFFRRRLFPTIFACRQFITHQGLEVNSGVEKSPRALIRTGDMIAVPEVAWENIYWELLMRIYYRRWGLYIRRRRLFKQRKKMLFFVRQRSNFQRKALIAFTKIVRDQKINSNVVETQKMSFSRLQELRLPFNENDTKAGISSWGKHKSNYAVINTNEVSNLFYKLFKLSPSSGITLQRFSHYNKTFFNRYSSRAKQNYLGKSSFITERKPHNNMLNTFTRRAYDIKNYIKNKSEKDNSIFAQKLAHYQKLAFSLRFRKSALPSSFRYINKSKRKHVVINFSFKRTKLLRFYFKKYKKSVQNKKIIRLKGVHFFIPSYIQMDFRTLRAVKIQSPSQEDIYYPFRISLPKRYSFYRSRGY